MNVVASMLLDRSTLALTVLLIRVMSIEYLLTLLTFTLPTAIMVLCRQLKLSLKIATKLLPSSVTIA
jgi:hypothetical protein